MFCPEKRGTGHPPSLFDERTAGTVRLHVGAADCGYDFSDRGRNFYLRLKRAEGEYEN